MSEPTRCGLPDSLGAPCELPAGHNPGFAHRGVTREEALEMLEAEIATSATLRAERDALKDERDRFRTALEIHTENNERQNYALEKAEADAGRLREAANELLDALGQQGGLGTIARVRIAAVRLALTQTAEASKALEPTE